MFSSKDVFQTASSGPYTIGKSVRLRSSASAYFNRTPSSSTNRRISTFSAWIKWSLTGSSAYPEIFSAAANGLLYKDAFYFSNNTLAIIFNGGITYSLVTTQVFRDPSAWYHFVMAIDTTQATASNRVKLYVNGLQITAFSTANYPIQNYDPNFNSAIVHNIGRSTDANDYYDGYMTEINFIDGQQLTPSSFGTTNALTGVWQPIKYTGTYGTNGFYLKFSDNSSNTATTIGKDYSGNGNNWTPNNISVTSGATYDSMVDSPTVSAVSSNYCVLNPLDKTSSTTASDGNLTVTLPNGVTGGCGSTIAVSSGKWYLEVTPTSGSNIGIGIVLSNLSQNGANDLFTTGYCYYQGNGNKYVNGSVSAYGSSYAANDVIGIALDITGLTITFYKNNVSQGAISIASGEYKFTSANGASASSQVATFNFGQRPFSYTPPTGFVALNTYNLPASTITNGAAYMAATTYTGTGATASISNSNNGVSFQPDFVWIKSRSNAYSHKLYDSVRGVYKELNSDSTAAESTDTNQLTAFNSNGWSVGSGLGTNGSGSTFVGWQWKAGGSSSSNTNGSITSTVSVGATQGFSVVTYTGTGANATVGHGLGVAPSMIIVKNRSTAQNWPTWHTSLGGGTNYLTINTTTANSTDTTLWNSTTPTSSVFSIGTAPQTNQSTSTFVAYCFAAVKGFSAFGSYTGNGSTDGPFVYTGFRPRYVLTKRTDSTSNWYIQDTGRSSYNVQKAVLAAESATAETADGGLDFLSNGFKLRNTDASENASGGTYIYAAFAENPFKNALAR